MQHPPKYQTPGSRSAAEGSGVTNSIPTQKEWAGELTPPGMVSYPSGSPSVEYSNGATFTAKAASTVVVQHVPLNYGS